MGKYVNIDKVDKSRKKLYDRAMSYREALIE